MADVLNVINWFLLALLDYRSEKQMHKDFWQGPYIADRGNWADLLASSDSRKVTWSALRILATMQTVVEGKGRAVEG